MGRDHAQRRAYHLSPDRGSAYADRAFFESTRGYTGQWQADLATTGAGGTRLTVTEQATTPSPLGRVLSRLFFDPEAFAAAYLDELGAETARRSLDRGNP